MIMNSFADIQQESVGRMLPRQYSYIFFLTIRQKISSFQNAMTHGARDCNNISGLQ